MEKQLCSCSGGQRANNRTYLLVAQTATANKAWIAESTAIPMTRIRPVKQRLLIPPAAHVHFCATITVCTMQAAAGSRDCETHVKNQHLACSFRRTRTRIRAHSIGSSQHLGRSTISKRLQHTPPVPVELAIRVYAPCVFDLRASEILKAHLGRLRNLGRRSPRLAWIPSRRAWVKTKTKTYI